MERLDSERHTQASPADYARHYSEKLVSPQPLGPLSLLPCVLVALSHAHPLAQSLSGTRVVIARCSRGDEQLDV